MDAERFNDRCISIHIRCGRTRRSRRNRPSHCMHPAACAPEQRERDRDRASRRTLFRSSFPCSSGVEGIGRRRNVGRRSGTAGRQRGGRPGDIPLEVIEPADVHPLAGGLGCVGHPDSQNEPLVLLRGHRIVAAQRRCGKRRAGEQQQQSMGDRLSQRPTSRYRKQWTRWSLISPAACMKA
jgi:hypothetical protein